MIDAESLEQMERIIWMLWVHRNLKTASLLSHSTVELAEGGEEGKNMICSVIF